MLSTTQHRRPRLIVVEDCCAERDPEVHRVLVEKVFPRQATVVTSARVMRTSVRSYGAAPVPIDAADPQIRSIRSSSRVKADGSLEQ